MSSKASVASSADSKHVLQWGKELVSNNRRQDASTTKLSLNRRFANGQASEAVEAETPHWQRAEALSNKNRTSGRSTPQTQTPPLASAGGNTTATTPPSEAAHSSQRGGGGGSGGGKGSTDRHGYPLPPRHSTPPTEGGLSPASPAAAPAASGATTGASPSSVVATSPASQAGGGSSAPPSAEASQLERELERLNKKQNHLEGMMNRNATEFANREKQLNGTLNTIHEKIKHLSGGVVPSSAASLSDPHNNTSSVTSPRISKFDGEIKQLEEQLWEVENALQKLLSEEEIEGAAVVRLADLISNIEKKNSKVSEDVGRAVKDTHRAVQLAVEHRDIVKRMPTLAVRSNTNRGQKNATESALLGASQALESLSTVPLPTATDLQALTEGTGTASLAEGIAVTMRSVLPGLVATHALTVRKQEFLQQAIESAEAQLEFQAVTMDEAHEALSQMQCRKTQLLEEIDTTRFETAQLEKERDSESADRRMLKEDIGELENKLDSVKKNIAKIHSNLQAAQREKEADKNEIQRICQQIENQEERAASLAKNKKDLVSALDNLEHEVNALRRESRNKSAQEDEARRDLARCTQEQAAGETTEKHHASKFQNSKVELDNLESQKGKLQRAIGDLKMELGDLDQQCETTIPRQIEEHQEELKAMRSKYAEQEAELSSVKKKVGDMRQKKKDIEGEIEVAKVVLLHKKQLSGDDSQIDSPDRKRDRRQFLQDASVLSGAHALQSSPLPVTSPSGPKSALELLGEPEEVNAINANPLQQAQEHQQQHHPRGHNVAAGGSGGGRRRQWSRSPSASAEPHQYHHGGEDGRMGSAGSTASSGFTGAPSGYNDDEENAHFQALYEQQHRHSAGSSGGKGNALINSEAPVRTLQVDPSRAPLLVTMEPRRYAGGGGAAPPGHRGNGPQRQPRPFPWQEQGSERASGGAEEREGEEGGHFHHAHPRQVALQERYHTGHTNPSSAASIVSLGSETSLGYDPHPHPQQHPGNTSNNHHHDDNDSHPPPHAPMNHRTGGGGGGSGGNNSGGGVVSHVMSQSPAAAAASGGPPSMRVSATLTPSVGGGGSGGNVRPQLKDRLATIQGRLHDVLSTKQGGGPRQTPDIRQ